MLGAVLQRAERLDDVLPILTADDFYFPQHRIIFKGILRLIETHDVVDLVSLASMLETTGELSHVGGTPYISSLFRSFTFGSNTPVWAATVRDLARRRRVMELAVKMYAAAADKASDVQEVAAGASNLVDGVLADKIDTGRQTPREVVRDYMEWLDAATDSGVGVPLPFEKAQRMTGGFLPGEMIVLAARPSNGKTALALNICSHLLSEGKKVGIVSLEMRTRSLMSRLASMSLNIDAQKFRNRTFNDEDKIQLKGFCDRFLARSVRFWDEPDNFSPSRMRAIVKSWKRQMGGLDFLVIDYLQLMGSDQIDGRVSYSREQEVARISKAIKRLALGEDVPIMVLAQLNRQAEKDSKPMLSHLRESGSLEQDADFVLFLSFWDPRTVGHEVDLDLDIAKGRSSQTGTVPVTFIRPFLRFYERPEGM